MPIKQDERMMGISTGLGAETLAVRSIAVHEQLSRLFQIEAELATEDGEIKRVHVTAKGGNFAFAFD